MFDKLLKSLKSLRLFVLVLSATIALSLGAQTSVSGIVYDSSGETIPGATVQVKGQDKRATVTDIEGRFTLRVPDLSVTLVARFIGYKTEEVKLDGRDKVDIVLKEDSELLNEVVAIGYGTAKKVSLTGSVSAISSKELLTAPMTNTSNMLTGKVSGLTAVQSTGRPGSDGAAIHVRGLNDFAASGPLCIVDGVPASMDNVNPNDIESVSVLKDAAAAIYGVQGANGVILITTKKGNEGQARISYDGVFSMVNNTAMPELMNAREYMYWHNRASEMDGYTPRYTADIQQQVIENAPGTIYGETDWQKQLWRTAFTQKHNISASGGTKKVKYFVSLGVLDQEGTMKSTDYRRYNLRTNIDISVTKGLNFMANISGYKAERRNAGFDLGNTYAWNPAFEATHALPIYKSTYNGLPLAQTTGGDGHFNPGASIANSGWQRNYNNEIYTNLKLEFDFAELVPQLKGLKMSVWGSYKYGMTKIRNFMNSYEQYVVNITSPDPGEPSLLPKPGTTEGGAFLKYLQEYDGWIFRPQVDFNRTFGKHTVGALYVYEAQKSTSDFMQGEANQFAALDPIDINLGVEIPGRLRGAYTNTSIVSHVGRLSYDFDSKYLVDFAFRYDGSYKFAPENRWGFFPSVSAGWVASSESFVYENLPWINFLKLRASWGKSGKDNITPFLYNSTFKTAQNSIVFGDTVYKNYYTQNAYLQRDLKWSTTESYNIGLDFDVLDRKLGAEIDVFYQYTKNLIESVSGEYAPSLGGYQPSLANTGSMDNRGIDFTIKHQLTVNKDFNYRIRGTFGFARNKILRRNLSSNYPTTLQPRIGEPLGVRYGLKSDGLYQTEEQLINAPRLDGTTWHASSQGPRLGDIRYVDINGDGRINFKESNSEVLDMVRIGYGTMPEITFSLNADLYYKDFYLNMLWQGVTHCDYMLGGNDQYKWVVGTMLNTAFDQNGNGVKYIAENSWTPENPDAKYPRLTTQSGGNNILVSDFWMVNGEYLRLKNLTLGYNVPEKVLTKTPFTGVNVYVSGTNVLTFSHCKYVDPETPSATFNLYPQQATWSLGLNVSF